MAAAAAAAAAWAWVASGLRSAGAERRGDEERPGPDDAAEENAAEENAAEGAATEKGTAEEGGTDGEAEEGGVEEEGGEAGESGESGEGRGRAITRSRTRAVRVEARVVRRPLGLGGSLVGLGFFCASLSPSLLPRSWVLQGAVSGIAAVLGYGLGSGITAVQRRALGLTPSPRARALAWRLLIAAAAVLSVLMLFYSAEWQREVRRTMAMDTGISWFPPVIAVLAALTFAGLLAIARSIRLGTRKLISLLGRFIPKLVAQVVGLSMAVFLVGVFADDVLFANFVEVMNNTSSLANGTTDPGTVPPRSGALSGGPGSLIPWDTLGREGASSPAGPPRCRS
ncbi:alpha/beta-hydrolase N-terminal domain-containing protein [Thermocatellispora tengchongensis]|uniref:alpha/beta-hydrolase N-terminal domain-containing protein n=1 Tax=Thermocatellispora tengchongensis TaxID=1073253 RepID=UPI0036361A85